MRILHSYMAIDKLHMYSEKIGAERNKTSDVGKTVSVPIKSDTITITYTHDII